MDTGRLTVRYKANPKAAGTYSANRPTPSTLRQPPQRKSIINQAHILTSGLGLVRKNTRQRLLSTLDQRSDIV